MRDVRPAYVGSGFKPGNTHEGYGFIERDQGGDLFVHISEVDENLDTLAKGQRVSFEEGASRRTGKLEAKNVTVV